MIFISADEMRRAERLAIDGHGIPGLDLMEAAGRNCAEVILREQNRLCGAEGNEGRLAVVMAGKGNNGGDGYVIARHLVEHGWRVRVLVLAPKKEIKGDAAVNLDLLDPGIVTFCIEPGSLSKYADDIKAADIIVDAMLGIGLRSELRGLYAEAVELMNGSGRPVVAVDIASGIDAATGGILGTAVVADLTVTFAFAKTGHILYPGAEHTGSLEIVDIGLPEEVEAAVEGLEFVDEEAAGKLLRKRGRCSHKGDFGHCLIFAGSTGKTGAASLAANTAVRTGSGLVTLAVPASLNPILEVKTTEAMTLPLEDFGKGHFSCHSSLPLDDALAGKDVVAVGPGIGRQPETWQLVRKLVREVSLPVVIDADGLNAIAEDVSVLQAKCSCSIVLTPHPGEMARLCGVSVAEVERDRISSAREFAVGYGVYLVLKGARTVIAAPDGRIAVNGSGNPGMASGGMGDVLTGVITSLLGQKYHPFDACRLGAFIHGYAADLVAEEKGEIGISAVDVQERLPGALKKLMRL